MANITGSGVRDFHSKLCTVSGKSAISETAATMVDNARKICNYEL